VGLGLSVEPPELHPRGLSLRDEGYSKWGGILVSTSEGEEDIDVFVRRAAQPCMPAASSTSCEEVSVLNSETTHFSTKAVTPEWFQRRGGLLRRNMVHVGLSAGGEYWN
jgi:hypothetical protein